MFSERIMALIASWTLERFNFSHSGILLCYSRKEDRSCEECRVNRTLGEINIARLPSLSKTLTTADFPRNNTVLRHVRKSTIISAIMTDIRVNIDTAQVRSIVMRRTLEEFAHVRLQLIAPRVTKIHAERSPRTRIGQVGPCDTWFHRRIVHLSILCRS